MDTYGYYTSRVEQMQEANLRIISYNFLNQSNHRQWFEHSSGAHPKSFQRLK